MHFSTVLRLRTWIISSHFKITIIFCGGKCDSPAPLMRSVSFSSFEDTPTMFINMDEHLDFTQQFLFQCGYFVTRWPKTYSYNSFGILMCCLPDFRRVGFMVVLFHWKSTVWNQVVYIYGRCVQWNSVPLCVSLTSKVKLTFDGSNIDPLNSEASTRRVPT